MITVHGAVHNSCFYDMARKLTRPISRTSPLIAASPGGDRPPNAFGLSKTRLVTIFLVLYVIVLHAVSPVI